MLLMTVRDRGGGGKRWSVNAQTAEVCLGGGERRFTALEKYAGGFMSAPSITAAEINPMCVHSNGYGY